MLVFRGTTLMALVSIVCLLLAYSGVDAVSMQNMHRLRDMHKSRSVPVAPSPAFKQQVKAVASEEVAAKSKLARSQATLDHEMKMLDLQNQEAALLLKLKASHEAREHAERQLVHQRLVVAQRETERLVNDLATTSKNRMLLTLQRLNSVIAHAMLPHSQTKPASIAIDSKLLQKKQTPAAADAAAADAATPTNSVESDAKMKLHKQLVAKAAEVVSAQLDGILNSEELAYIKAHNELGDTDSSQTAEGEITEQDTGALPGETADQHFNRLSKEADALMAKAYPFIRCEGGGASGASAGSGGSGSSAHSSESSTVAGTVNGTLSEIGTETASASGATGEETGASGASGDSATGTGGTAAETPAAGASGETAAAGAPAVGATAATGDSSSTGEVAAQPAADAAAPPTTA